MPASSTITVGGTELELGDLSGTRITGIAWSTEARTADLAQALEEAERSFAGPAAGDERLGTVEVPEGVAESLERAGSLWAAVASGRAEAELSPAEIDGLLGLFERLADAARTAEALQLARPLERLLMVTGRWPEVGRLLGRASAMAQSGGHQAALAWAKHEQGTLRVAARDVDGAQRKLRAAHALRRRVGDRTGSAATEANLRAARRPHRRAGRRPIATLLPFVAVGVVAAGLFAGLGDFVPRVATSAAPPAAPEPERHGTGTPSGERSARAPGPHSAPTAAPMAVPVVEAATAVTRAQQPPESAPSGERRPIGAHEGPRHAPQPDRAHPPQPAQPPTGEAAAPLVQVSLRIDTDGAEVLVDGSERVCPPTCELSFDPGAEVELTARPAGAPATPLDSFEWGGGCEAPRGTGRTCRLVVDQATEVSVRHRTVLHTVLDALGVSALTSARR